MMRREITCVIAFLSLCIVLSTACSSSGRIDGVWHGGEGQTVYLSEAQTVIDSATVDSRGRFRLTCHGDDCRFLTLSAGSSQWPLFWDDTVMRLELVDDSEVSGGLRFNLLEGGYEQQVMSRVAKVVADNAAYEKSVMRIFEDPALFADAEAGKQAIDRLDSVYSVLNADVARLLDSTTRSQASLYLIADFYLKQPLQLEKAKQAFEQKSSDLQGTPLWHRTADKLQRYIDVYPGGKAPDIALADTKGRMRRLSELRGKWVILDFGASWCVPCMEEMKTVKQLYDRFHDRGLEVFGVSSDTDSTAWIKTIERKKLDWIHVSGLGDATKSVRDIYVVDAIPCMLFIDPSGKIVSRGLRGDDLIRDVESHID